MLRVPEKKKRKKRESIRGTPKEKSALKSKLKEHGCDIEEILAIAIIKRDLQMIQALKDILPFFLPRFKDKEQAIEAEKEPTAKLESGEDLDNLIRLAR